MSVIDIDKNRSNRQKHNGYLIPLLIFVIWSMLSILYLYLIKDIPQHPIIIIL